MKKHFFVIAFLSFMMLLVGCSDNSTKVSETTSSDTSQVTQESESTVVTEAADPFDKFEKKDLEGKVISYLTRPFTDYVEGQWSDIYTEGVNGEQLNDAMYERNSRVMDLYNITLQHVEGDASGMRKTILAQDDIYSFANLAFIEHISLANSGSLKNLNIIDNFGLDSPWWDKTCTAEMSVCKKLFMATGDINTMDDRYTWCYYFNKNMQSDLGLENPYTIVSKGTWTMDKLNEMAQAAASDTNGDGIMDQNDTWGCISESYGYYLTVLGSGERSIEKDKNDVPFFSLASERNINALQKSFNLYGNESVIFIADNWTKIASKNVWDEYSFPMFTNGQGLFFMGAIDAAILKFRDMQYDYGMVPTPKLDEAQEDYHCSISTYGATAISIPVTNADFDNTALILNAMGAASITGVTPAYYDTVLINKGLRDDESLEMLKIIMNSKMFDLGFLNNWGGSSGLIGELIKGGDFASAIAKKESAINTAILKIIDEYSKF